MSDEINIVGKVDQKKYAKVFEQDGKNPEHKKDKRATEKTKGFYDGPQLTYDPKKDKWK